ncbi:Holliday junction branch migration protein RuvA [Corynebacterium halotolerans]|uniref:Holliday junction branch migration protein RuvA n=1 Tax=Corynebacterium halotolerans TaxID=225326 RepID=UPI003CEAF998
MIASLRGTVTTIGLDHAVIECSGVGYLFTATPRTLAELRRGEESSVLTTLVVREDSMQLYGFTDSESREMFHLLQTVSGLGPRLAVASQSVLDPGEIARAVRDSDSKTLQRIPGVGKRVAERMILELKEKVSHFAEPVPEGPVPAAQLPVGADHVADEVTQALLGLGFAEKEISKVVAEVLAQQPELDTAVALRASLTALGKK